MLAMAVSLSTGNVFVGKPMARSSTPAMMFGGFLTDAAGSLTTSTVLAGHVHLWVASVTMMVYSGDIALTIVPMMSTILSATPGGSAGTASGLLNAARQTGSLLGVAVTGAVITAVPGLTRAAPMVFGLMVLSYVGTMVMVWTSRRPAATALAA